jgi:hypothetical protein
MGRPIDGISYDAKFIRDHKLQPGWFNVLKVVILVGAPVAYALLFGWKRATVFVAMFLLLSLVVHYTYRAKTDRLTRSKGEHYADPHNTLLRQRSTKRRALAQPHPGTVALDCAGMLCHPAQVSRVLCVSIRSYS